LFHRGQQAADQGDTVRAEQYLSMALDRGFDRAKVLPILLRVCLSSSRLRAALNHAEPYLREHPNDQHLRYLVATIHLGLGQIEEARIELFYLLRINPNNVQAHYLLGILESGLDKRKGNEHFLRYLALAPNGDHATEVRSRLTDLAVRENLESADKSPGELAAANTAEVSTSTEIATQAKDNSAWFGTIPQRSVTPSTQLETP